MFEVVFKVLTWMFAIGAIGCLLFVIPITALRLFSALFEKDTADETNSSQQVVI
jgi:hypothetical protein